jgi:hypothetical protein
MTNKIEEIGEDVLHAVEYPFVHTAQAIAVLSSLIKHSSPVKDAIVALVKAAEVVDVDAVSVIAAKGIDVPADIKAFADVEAFFIAFKTQFLPVIEAAYKDLAADVK